MPMPSKIASADALAPILDERRRAGRTVVFTNGCFDLIHAGHVRYLSAARAQGDMLVVGLNSDASVRSIKGDRRPIMPEAERAEVLAGLACVDFVVIFPEPDPFRLIQALKPHVLVKGADWPEDRIVGADVVLSLGGRVHRVELVDGVSTTRIIARILERFASADTAS